MAFSGALTLTDLNDFITPSQACIKPVEQSNNRPTKEEGAASTQIHIDSSGSYYEVADTQPSGASPAPRKLETAQISLNDCLACSGCITSAESVLITMQSHEEVLSVLKNNPPTICVDHKTTVLSISPQSLASLAATISSTSTSTVTLDRVLQRVTAFAHSIGFEHVYDTTFARHLALLEHAHEFHERQQAQHGVTDEKDSAGKLPMLASACPGWVCYAEKTHAEMLPFISRTKSPQQVMGTLVKIWLGEKWGKKPDKIYHVTVMPCYDKKLEASRQDFYNDAYATRDVDCVITTGELELMMRERGWDLSQPTPSELERVSSPPPLPLPSSTSNASKASSVSGASATSKQLTGHTSPDLDYPHPAGPTLPTLLTHPGSSSGSYLYSLLISLASEHSGAELTTRQVRGSDFEEYILRVPDSSSSSSGKGNVIFKGARCYGFRNLQNVVRRVGKMAGVQVGRGAAGRLAAVRAAKQNKGNARIRRRAGRDGEAEEVNGIAASDEEEDRPYDYVEVMACPGGCVNGGGQLRPILDSSNSSNTTINGTTNNTETTVAMSEPPNEMRWGTRAWTRRVEEAYWHDLPTPPPSPSLKALSPSSDPSAPIQSASSLTLQHQPQAASSRLQAADALALQVLSDLCHPHPHTSSAIKSWSDTLDVRAEARRRSYFRTSYRAVVSEISGIQVQW